MISYILRKVPKNWEHPKNTTGNYIPLYDGSYSAYSKKYDEEKELWVKDFSKNLTVVNGKITYTYAADEAEDAGIVFEEWYGKKRPLENYRPDWSTEERTHFQMYEDETAGTPVSPVFERIADLASWLYKNLADDRYAYSVNEWLDILTSSQPSVEMTIRRPVVFIEQSI